MAYDQANRPDTTTLANGIVQDYTLNGAGGLTQISYDKGATAYGKINDAADAAGRRTKMWGSYGRVTLPTATSASAVYNLANRPTSWNGQTVTHDADGNMTAGAQTFTWNARGQLTATSAGNQGYGYDGLGRRSTRSVSGTPNARYLYDGLNLVQEQNGTGTVLANTLTGPGLDQVYRRTEAAGNRNLLTDAQGSVIALSDGAATPTVPTSYTYAPYGAQTTTGTASTNPFGFTGREADQTSGLQYNRARYLSPAMGRFISEDPIGIAGGMNVYGYANQAPTVFGDPLGLDPGVDTPVPGWVAWLAGELGSFLSGAAGYWVQFVNQVAEGISQSDSFGPLLGQFLGLEAGASLLEAAAYFAIGAAATSNPFAIVVFASFAVASGYFGSGLVVGSVLAGSRQ